MIFQLPIISISIIEIPFSPKQKGQKVNSAQCSSSMNISNLNSGLIFLFTFVFVNFGLSLFRLQNEKIFPPKGCDPWTNSISSPRLFLFFSSSYITKIPFRFIRIGTKKMYKEKNWLWKDNLSTARTTTVNVSSTFAISERRRNSSINGSLQTACKSKENKPVQSMKAIKTGAKLTSGIARKLVSQGVFQNWGYA